jgi:hypothetical protein
MPLLTVNGYERTLYAWAWKGAKPASQSPVGANWHYDKRAKLNQNEEFMKIPNEQLKELGDTNLKDVVDAGTPKTMTIQGDEYYLLPSGKSLYHSTNGTGTDAAKYVSKNGKELVINITDTLDPHIELSPERIGTYNYYDPSSALLLHAIYDMIPYWFYGNSPDDSTPWPKRVHPKLPDISDAIEKSFGNTDAPYIPFP